MSDDEMERLEAWLVKLSADRHLSLYLRTGNGLLIWRAFLEYRNCKRPVPENILAKLEQWGRAVLMADGDAAVARAIESHTVARRTAKRRLREEEANRDVMEPLLIRERELGQSPTAAARAVADELGVKINAVKVKKTRWLNPGGRRKAKRESSGRDLATVWR